MIRILICLFALLLLTAGCGKSGPEYEIHFGEKVIKLSVTYDESQTRDEIKETFQKIWEKLEVGHSKTFQYIRNIPEAPDAKEAGPTAIKSEKIRFFKKEDGIEGIEQVNENSTTPLFIGSDFDWKDIEDYLFKVIDELNKKK